MHTESHVLYYNFLLLFTCWQLAFDLSTVYNVSVSPKSKFLERFSFRVKLKLLGRFGPRIEVNKRPENESKFFRNSFRVARFFNVSRDQIFRLSPSVKWHRNGRIGHKFSSVECKKTLFYLSEQHFAAQNIDMTTLYNNYDDDRSGSSSGSGSSSNNKWKVIAPASDGRLLPVSGARNSHKPHIVLFAINSLLYWPD